MNSHYGSEHAVRDAALLERVRNGDADALAALMRYHATWLADSVLSIVGSMDLAQDAIQDVFIRLWDLRATLNIQGSITAYLYRAVRNRAQDIAARERTQHNLQARVAADHTRVVHIDNAGDAGLVEEEFHIALERALETLQPRTREIFRLRVVHGLGYAEIAEMLEIGVPTIHVQMSRAMRQLATVMAQQE